MILQCGKSHSTIPFKAHSKLVGGLEHFLFFHILGMSSSQLTNSYFSEGWPNHQPVNPWAEKPSLPAASPLVHGGFCAARCLPGWKVRKPVVLSKMGSLRCHETWEAEKSTQNSGFKRNSSPINSVFSSQPCFMKPEDIFGGMHNLQTQPYLAISSGIYWDFMGLHYVNPWWTGGF